ncbi:MAG: serine O-acetyltransferase [Clostridia bacterium]|nr:serine O-acetyltransferase [Clostridia bacterium]
MFKNLRYDIHAIMDRDPAARSPLQVFFLYPGLWAVIYHRLSHFLYKHRHFFLARMISNISRRATGIEIHPGATIGRGLVIDHGMGIVIGETAEIGDNVTLYQCVTLGGTGKDIGKRHPTIGNNVLIGAGAKVLGPFRVGDNSKIAANAVVLSEVPPNCTCVGVPARVVKRNNARIENLDQVHIPDPVAQELCKLQIRLEKLEKMLAEKETQTE